LIKIHQLAYGTFALDTSPIYCELIRRSEKLMSKQYLGDERPKKESEERNLSSLDVCFQIDCSLDPARRLRVGLAKQQTCLPQSVFFATSASRA
jgi:hypothetical protein